MINLLITGSFLKGILDRDSFSIRPHTTEKTKINQIHCTMFQLIKKSLHLFWQLFLDLLAGLISSPPKPLHKRADF